MTRSPSLPMLLAQLALFVACHGDEERAQTKAAASAPATRALAASTDAPKDAAAPPSATAAPSSSAVKAEERRPTSPLYVRLPGSIPPLERSDKFESPLDALLRERKLGQVSGGGTGLKPGGGIDYARLDVDVYDVKAALPVVIQELRTLKAPKGTTVEELRDDGPAIQHRVW